MGVYVRHVRGLQVKNLRLDCAAKDYRAAVVLDDVAGDKWEGMVVKEAGVRPKQQIFRGGGWEVGGREGGGRGVAWGLRFG